MLNRHDPSVTNLVDGLTQMFPTTNWSNIFDTLLDSNFYINGSNTLNQRFVEFMDYLLSEVITISSYDLEESITNKINTLFSSNRIATPLQSDIDSIIYRQQEIESKLDNIGDIVSKSLHKVIKEEISNQIIDRLNNKAPKCEDEWDENLNG